jgi:hypothetical protein
VLAPRIRSGHYALVAELSDLDKRKARLQLVGLVVVVVLATWFFFRFGMYSL